MYIYLKNATAYKIEVVKFIIMAHLKHLSLLQLCSHFIVGKLCYAKFFHIKNNHVYEVCT